MKYQKRFSLKNYYYEMFYGTGSGLLRIAPTINWGSFCNIKIPRASTKNLLHL